MARFRFELEAVLRQRLLAERGERVKVAELERERLEIEASIRRCQGIITQEKADLTRRLGGGGAAVDLGSVRTQANASLRAVAEAQRGVLRLAGVHERLKRARAALLERSIERRAMESLKERRRDAWARREKRAEEAALDELVVSRHGRDRPDGAGP